MPHDNKKSSRLFADGEKVKELVNGKVFTITSATWNGYVWMYAFKETDMRCGEGYLTDRNHVKKL